MAQIKISLLVAIGVSLAFFAHAEKQSVSSDQFINAQEKEIRDGQIKSGASFLVKLDPMQGNPDLKKIEELRDLAEAKGVHLAIVDMSGVEGTVSLGTDKTCVVSVGNMGYRADMDSLLKAMTPGKNLEQAYLEARARVVSPARPDISSPAGKRAKKSIDDMELQSQQVPKSCGALVDNNILTKLKTQLSAIDSKTNRSSIAAAKRSLADAFAQYEQQQKVAKKAFYDMQRVDKTYCTTKEDDSCADFDQLQALSKTAPAYANGMLSAEYKKWKVVDDKYQAVAKTLNKYATSVQAQERKAYDLIYKDAEADSKAVNPCKEFIL